MYQGLAVATVPSLYFMLTHWQSLWLCITSLQLLSVLVRRSSLFSLQTITIISYPYVTAHDVRKYQHTRWFISVKWLHFLHHESGIVANADMAMTYTADVGL